MSARPLPMPVNPALLKHAEQRRKSLENRVADQITRFAGSMTVSALVEDDRRYVFGEVWKRFL